MSESVLEVALADILKERYFCHGFIDYWFSYMSVVLRLLFLFFTNGNVSYPLLCDSET